MRYTETAPIKSVDDIRKILSIPGRDGFLFMVALHTALRVGEYIVAKWVFFISPDGNPKEYHVFEIEKKRKKSTRMIFYPPYMRRRIMEWYNECGRPSLDEYVFQSTGRTGENGYLSSKTVNNLIKKHFVDLGIETRNPSSHTFRKTMARRFWETNGLEATMKLLGHESEKDTLRYIGIDEDEMREKIGNFKYI